MPQTPDNRIHVVYGSALLTPAGRVADSTILKALGWQIGMPIDIQPSLPGVVTITTVPEAKHAVTANGQVPIPVGVRRRVGLRVGDRVLLAAHPHQNRLIVVCQVVLDDFLFDLRARIDGGEQS